VRAATLQTPRPVKKEGEEVLQALEQPVEQTMVRQAVTLQSMEAHGGADPHLYPMEATHTGAVRGALCPVGETPHWSRGRV